MVYDTLDSKYLNIFRGTFRFIKSGNSSVNILLSNRGDPDCLSGDQAVSWTGKSGQDHLVTLFIADVDVVVLFKCFDHVLNGNIRQVVLHIV